MRCRGTNGPSAARCSRHCRPGRESARSSTTSATSWSRPDRQGLRTVFVAHMDEVGYQIGSIAPDGTVTLRGQGGVVASAWEGQTALVHFDPPGAPSTVTGLGNDIDPRWKTQSLAATAPPPLRGVFRIRGAAQEKNPGGMQAWFGLDAKGLAERGVVVGMQVTSHKEGLRLGRTRYTARSLDDRAGTAALLCAIQTDQSGPAARQGDLRLVGPRGGWLAWGGSHGSPLRPNCRSASTRSTPSSPPTRRSSRRTSRTHHSGRARCCVRSKTRACRRIRSGSACERAADAARIPLQVGLTQGSTDGTTFTFWGAPNQGLSWPGRYSHSPGEVLDLRDLDMLARLIATVASAGER